MTQTTQPRSIRWTPILLKLLIILTGVGVFGAFYLIETMPERLDAQQTIVLGGSQFAPGSEAGVRVVVQEAAGGRPIEGAQVDIALQPAGGGQPISLFSGQTGAGGSLPVRFTVPAEVEGEPHLVVKTSSPAGEDTVDQPIRIQRDFRLLLSTDKPLYQPGQTIHLRALALSTLDMTPARGARVEFLVEDPKGNKVFRQGVNASDFGVAAVDFVLGGQVNQGNYRLSASIGATGAERTVEVKPYVLPKFGLKVTTDRNYYLPGQRVSGVIQADYFYGKPVAGGQVHLTGLVYDVGRTVVVDLQGSTDANGAYEFGFDLPAYFAGSGLDSGQASFGLEVTVIDQAEHAEQTSQLVPVAAEPLVIEAIPESGRLKPGVENIIYLLVAYPDGRPAAARLDVSMGGSTSSVLQTGPYGLAEFKITPPAGGPYSLQVTARDETGLSASRLVELEADSGFDAVLLRADRAAYLAGETMELVVLTPVEAGDVYLDVVKEGQTLSTLSAKVQQGRATFTIDASPDMVGTVELHAYKVLLDGTIVRDTRVVVVDAPRDVAIQVSPDQDTYLPGDTASLAISTTGNDGQGLPAALGVAVVDESVFALQQQDPGFARLYFLLEADLLEPRYQIKGFELPASLPPDRREERQAQDTSAKAAWAAAPEGGFGLQVNSRPVKLEALAERQQQNYGYLSLFTAGGLAVIPLLFWVAAAVFLHREGLLKRSLKRMAAALGILLLVGIALACSLYSSSDLFYRIDEESILAVFGLAAAAGLLAMAGYAWVKGDEAAKYFFLLSLAWGTLLVALINLSDEGINPPPDGLVIAILVLFAAIPTALLAYGQGLWVRQRRWPGGLVTGLGSLFALPVLTVLPVLPFTMLGSMGGMAPMPMADVGRQEAVPAPALMAAGAAPVEEKAIPTETAAPAREAVEHEAGAAPPRLRQFFPETLYWNPEVVTDENGAAELSIPIADSITTWRLTALASSQDGRLGFTSLGLRVFQDFFVDIDLPVALTQDDEISIPVGVFNYLPEPQQVRLVVEPEPWFELLGPAEQTLTIPANDIDVVYFPIRVVKFGRVGFQVTAWGSKFSDAIRREVTVVPNGREIRQTRSDFLREGAELELAIPATAVAGTPYVEVKVYPGALAQVVEGLEKILRLPYG